MEKMIYIVASYLVLGFIFMTAAVITDCIRGRISGSIKAELRRLFPTMILVWPIIPYMAVRSILDRIDEKQKLTFWLYMVCIIWPLAIIWFLIVSQDGSISGFPIVISAIFGLIMAVSMISLVKWALIALFRWFCDSIIWAFFERRFL